MDKTNKLSAFLSEDMAYFLGLVVGRGTIFRGSEVNRLIIEFPFKNLEAQGITKKYDTQMYLSGSLDRIVNRLKKLGLNVRKESDIDNKTVSLIIEWHGEDIAWRLLNYLLNEEHTDYHSFRIPKAIFEADKEKQKEFLRGYFDVTGHIRASNARFGQKDQQRVYLEVDHRNWFLVLDLYRLLTAVGIFIESIDFGHPNFRDPEHKKQSGFWAKEHQIKIFANHFLPIGSYLTHKEEILKELAALNNPKLGTGKKIVKIKKKPMNPEENSEKLPEFLRGKHFDHYTQLLKYLDSLDKNE
jgi:hypothetical protein